jgi:hypothetical protein
MYGIMGSFGTRSTPVGAIVIFVDMQPSLVMTARVSTFVLRLSGTEGSAP